VLRLLARRADLRPRLADERRGVGAGAARRGFSVGHGNGGGGRPLRPPFEHPDHACGSPPAALRSRLDDRGLRAVERRLHRGGRAGFPYMQRCAGPDRGPTRRPAVRPEQAPMARLRRRLFPWGAKLSTGRKPSAGPARSPYRCLRQLARPAGPAGPFRGCHGNESEERACDWPQLAEVDHHEAEMRVDQVANRVDTGRELGPRTAAASE
jgi:hypothetical protein